MFLFWQYNKFTVWLCTTYFFPSPLAPCIYKTRITTLLLHKGKNFSSTVLTPLDKNTACCSTHAELPCKTKPCKGLRRKRVPHISMISRMERRSSCGNYSFPFLKECPFLPFCFWPWDSFKRAPGFHVNSRNSIRYILTCLFFHFSPFLYLFIHKHVLLCKACCAFGDEGKLRSKLLGVLPHSIFSTFPVSLSNAFFHETWWWTKVWH